jgi:hypothetical protein
MYTGSSISEVPRTKEVAGLVGEEEAERGGRLERMLGRAPVGTSKKSSKRPDKYICLTKLLLKRNIYIKTV